jgi:ketosteroid isomerase-like protein
MTEEKRDRVARAFDALNGGDVEQFLGIVDPDAEVVPLSGEMEGTVYHGHDGIRAWWAKLSQVFREFHQDVADLRELDASTLIVLRARGRGRGNDVPFEQTIWTVSTWRGSRFVTWRAFRREVDAVAAAERGRGA